MKLDARNHPHYHIFDCNGAQVNYVQEYNTETRVVSLFIPDCSGTGVLWYKTPGGKPRPLTVTLTLKGSYATDEKGNLV